LGERLAYVDWVHIPVVETAHVAIWQETVREEREQHELWEREELITGQREACATVDMLEAIMETLQSLRTEAQV